jgi:hypothetical protein
VRIEQYFSLYLAPEKLLLTPASVLVSYMFQKVVVEGGFYKDFQYDNVLRKKFARM